MSDLEKSLDAIFAARAEAERQAQIRADAAAKKREEIANAFSRVRDEIIKPALEEVQGLLEKRGVNARIEIGTRPHTHSISMTMTESGKSYQGMMTPRLTISASPIGDSVDFHKTTQMRSGGGMSGGDGSCPLEQVTKELVQTKLMAIIRESFG